MPIPATTVGITNATELKERIKFFKVLDFILTKILATNIPNNNENKTERMDWINVNCTIAKISLFVRKLLKSPKPLIKSDDIEPIIKRIKNKVT